VPPFGVGNAGADRSSPSGSSAVLIATAVCEALWGSTPIITAATETLPSLLAHKDRGGHAQFRDFYGAHASFEPRHGEAPASWHVVRKPAQQGGRRFENQASRESGNAYVPVM
jgi:hypothetical protein